MLVSIKIFQGIFMTYLKCTSSGKVKFATALFWACALSASALLIPALLLPLGLLAMLNLAYLMLQPVPLPIVLSFVCMVTLSLYVVYMRTIPLS